MPSSGGQNRQWSWGNFNKTNLVHQEIVINLDFYFSQNIWKMTDDNDSSLTSFQSIDDAYENVKYSRRDGSGMDR